MKVHFDPYADEDYAPDIAPCGVRVGEEYCATGSWKAVDCKRCLSAKARLQRQHEETEADIVAQMGSMVDFFKMENAK